MDIKNVILSWVLGFLLTLALAAYFIHKGYDIITALGIVLFQHILHQIYWDTCFANLKMNDFNYYITNAKVL